MRLRRDPQLTTRTSEPVADRRPQGAGRESAGETPAKQTSVDGFEDGAASAALAALAVEVRSEERPAPNRGAEAGTLGARLLGWARTDEGRRAMSTVALGLSLVGVARSLPAATVHAQALEQSPSGDALATADAPASPWLATPPSGPAADAPGANLSPLAAVLQARTSTAVSKSAVQTRVQGRENADRALRAFDQLQSRRDASATLRARLSPQAVNDLVDGVARRRTSSERGVSGVLEARHVRFALDAIDAMPATHHAALQQLLADAGGGAQASGGADAGTERALIYKAVAARAPAFASGDAQRADDALAEVQTFAEAIRGAERTLLVRLTSALDLDDVNTSTLDADHVRATGDTRVDNDGLNQRFSTSCGPTTAQILRAEADPVYALSLHTHGISAADADGAIAAEQRAVLTGGGGRAVSQVSEQAWKHLRTALNDLQDEGALTAGEVSAFRSYAAGKTDVDAGVSQTLELVRQRDGGHPSSTELWAMRADGSTRGKGMSGREAFNAIAQQGTHVDYDYQRVPRGKLAQYTDQIAELLQDGQDVGLRVADGDETGHYMMIADVRGDGASRRFQVGDPWSGKNAWVSEAELVDGSFLKDVFDMSYPEITHFYADAASLGAGGNS
jgi:hypothetical protein